MAVVPKKFKTGAQVRGKLTLPDESSSKALTVSSTGEVTSSVTTDAELAFVSGATSNLQAQITANSGAASAAQADATQALSDAAAAQADIDAHIVQATAAHAASAISVTPVGNLGAVNVQAALTELQGDIDALEASGGEATEALVTLSGVPALSEDLGTFTGDIIPDASTVKGALQSLETAIESLPDPMEYKGLWNASTNTPTLTDGTGDNGDVYQVTVSGTQFTPAITFAIGDKVVYNGATAKYEKWDQTESVASVFGRVGVVTAQSGDYTTDLVTEATNLYFTDGRAQTAAVVNSTAGAETVQAASVAAMKAYVTAAIGAGGSPGDIGQTTFAPANNQVAPANVTGFAFANASVRSFVAHVSVAISATTPLFEEFELHAIQKSGVWNMSIESTGDESGVSFDISNLGQVTYTSANVAGFTAAVMKFRAEVTNL